MTTDFQNSVFPLQYDLVTIKEVAQAIVKKLGHVKIWLFEGEMGAGKTTLIKELSEVLSVVDNVTSPTFSIVNEYLTNTGNALYHFDFYRIKSETEAMDIGFDEYLYSGNLCFIEWPSKIPNLLPDKYATVKIDIVGEKERRCDIIING